jgi:type II secretory pathway component PulF
MSDVFILAEEPVKAEPNDANANPVPGTAAPTKAWQPSSKSESFQQLIEQKPTSQTTTAKRGKKGRADEADLVAPVVPLPEPKRAKKISASQQAKLDKIQLVKEREADNAAIRINGTDDVDVEVPKKPWLTFFSGKRARPDEVAETLTDLASMLENGESEHKSVNELAVQYSDYDIGQAYERIVMLLDRGVTLGAAMADQMDTFPPVVRELLGAAKMPKDTHRNLRQAAIIIVEADNIKAQIKSALFKPGLLVFFLLIFAFVAIQWLLPMTAGMFSGIGADVPPTTVLVMAVGAILKWVLLGAVVLVILGNVFWMLIGKRNEKLATIADSISLKAPLIGDITRMSVAARFCDVLGACLSVGMSEMESLETAGRACGNRALKTWVDEHVGRQRAGLVSLSDVAKTEMLPWNFRNRMETTSSITRRIEILQELASTFHAKAQLRLTRFSERVGPISEGVVVLMVVFVVLMVVSPVLTFIPTMIATMN